MSLKTSLVSWFALEEASGNRVDSHGSQDLTEVNTVTRQTGVVGFAAEMREATNERLIRTSEAALQTGDIDFTWASWVYPYVNATDANFMIIGKDNSVAGEREYYLKFTLATDRFQAAVFKAGDTGVTLDADNFGAVPEVTWSFVVFWHDATANTLNIQVNDGAIDSVGTGGSLQAASDAVFMLGRREFGGAEENIDGLMDETPFWKRLLTSRERTWLYNGGSGRSYAEDLTVASQVIMVMSKTQDFYDQLKKGLIPSWDLQRRYKEVFI